MKLVATSSLLLLLIGLIATSTTKAQRRMMMSPGKMSSVASARTQHLLGSVSPDGKSITVTQCRCSDIDECNEELE